MFFIIIIYFIWKSSNAYAGMITLNNTMVFSHKPCHFMKHNIYIVVQNTMVPCGMCKNVFGHATRCHNMVMMIIWIWPSSCTVVNKVSVSYVTVNEMNSPAQYWKPRGDSDWSASSSLITTRDTLMCSAHTDTHHSITQIHKRWTESHRTIIRRKPRSITMTSENER